MNAILVAAVLAASAPGARNVEMDVRLRHGNDHRRPRRAVTA
jgi:hypothetical protein